MIYRFIDDAGTFEVKDPHRYNLYLPLTDSRGRLLSSISPNLSGDIKSDNDHFLTPPASIEDLRSSLLCRREFFIQTEQEFLRLSRPLEEDTLEAGLLFQKVHKRSRQLSIEILNFVPHDLPVEVMSVTVSNITKKNLSVVPTSFIPLFGRSEKNLRDHRHVTSLLNRIRTTDKGITLTPSMVFDERGHREGTSVYFVFGYDSHGKGPEKQFPTLDEFYGEGDIIEPHAVTRPFKSGVPGQRLLQGKEACAAFRFRTALLQAGSSVTFVLVMGIGSEKERPAAFLKRLNTVDKVARSFEATKAFWRNRIAFGIDCGDRERTGWLAWVTLQPTLRRLFGCSFLPHFDYGKGGRGWRDLWQDGLTLLLTEPDKARPIIENSFRGVRLDGSNATIITREGDFIADRNAISRVWMDHGVWPYLTTRLYIHKTGDLDFLLSQQTYFRDHYIHRGRATDAAWTALNGYAQKTGAGEAYRGSILEHLLVQNLVQFFNVGEHNCVKLENADWNDGLDMAAERGESAAFSFMYAHNIKDLCSLLEKLSHSVKEVEIIDELMLLLDTIASPVDYADHRKKQERLKRYLTGVEKISGAHRKVQIVDLIKDLEAKWRHMADWLIRHEWLDTEGFFNGYYDNRAMRVEGRKARGTRMMLQSQVFALMSGFASREQSQRTWKAIRKHLRDRKLSGIRLNTDFFSLYLDMGRAFGFSYGDKENGAFFSHMNVMLAKALFTAGMSREGWQVLDSIYTMATASRAGITPGIPEYFNGEGRGLYLYLTGSASWYIYTLLEEAFGIRFAFGDIVLSPQLFAQNLPRAGITVKIPLENALVSITYTKERNARSHGLLRLKELSGPASRIQAGSGGFRIERSLLKPGKNSFTAILG